MSVEAKALGVDRPAGMSGNIAGMLAMAGAMSAFVVNDALVKVAAKGMPTGQILFIRGGFAALLLAIAAIAFRAYRPPLMLATSAFGWRIFGEVTATAIFIWAFVHVPFAEAQTITQFAPIALGMQPAPEIDAQVDERHQHQPHDAEDGAEAGPVPGIADGGAQGVVAEQQEEEEQGEGQPELGARLERHRSQRRRLIDRRLGHP
mgnify:CR=1 FL=1